MAMIRWIIENQRYDAKYLSNANKAAATADGEPSWSNLTWLVKTDAEGPATLLAAKRSGQGDKSFFVAVKEASPSPSNRMTKKILLKATSCLTAR
jgi:anaerobic selenocysteine-containing dehydrogenase